MTYLLNSSRKGITTKTQNIVIFGYFFCSCWSVKFDQSQTLEAIVTALDSPEFDPKT